MAKICPKCKVENLDDANFCDNCGNTLNINDSISNANKKSEGYLKLMINWWNQRSTNFKAVTGVIVCFLGILIIFELISIFTFSVTTYNDNQISFNCINGWKIAKSNNDDNKMVEGYYEFNGPINLTITKNTSNGQSLTDFKSIWRNETIKKGDEITSEKPITVDGVNAYEIISSSYSNGLESKYVILVKNSTIYTIIFTTKSDLFSYRRSIDTIVNSFHVK